MAKMVKCPTCGTAIEVPGTPMGQVVKCPGCGQVYSWSPDLDIVDAVCTKCGKTYNCEFGELAP